MEIVLRGLQYDKCLVYLDDIIVIGENFDKAMKNLRSVFLSKLTYNYKFRNASFFKPKLSSLDIYFLNKALPVTQINHLYKGIGHDRKKKGDKRFCGFGSFSYYRTMVPNFAEIALPLTRLTKKKVAFEWGPTQEAAFNHLKTCLTNPPVLSFPLESGGSFILDCDSSVSAIGSVISQYQFNTECVIACGSKTLNGAQRNYCTTKRELYSIVYFVKIL